MTVIEPKFIQAYKPVDNSQNKLNYFINTSQIAKVRVDYPDSIITLNDGDSYVADGRVALKDGKLDIIA